MPWTWFDIVLALIIVWSALSGLRAGLARVIIGVIATILGFLAGFWCYRIVAAKLTPWVATPAIADVLGFLIIFVGVMILGSLISALLSRLLKWIGLSWFNHFLGGVAGFLRGALIAAALVDIIVAFSPSPTPDFLLRSRVVPYAGEVSSWLAELAPQELKDAFSQQMQNLRQFWAKPQNKHDRQV
ncbi:MAG: CvpA family protein [Acidobacteriaceae bacterium]|nr:CvpA family protein [Acidobacteriaceae bacterium]MBV9295778.1 CvpA family protein [Acidobacteriaceae bacterium]